MKRFWGGILGLVLALAGGQTGPAQPQRHLAPVSAVPATAKAAAHVIPQEVRDMPAWELLEALDLLALREDSSLRILETRRDAEGYTAVWITVGPFSDRFPAGREILRYEMGYAREFALLYNSKGFLVAVFPILETGAQGGIHPYFDLSAYYVEIPEIGAPGARQRWDDFRREWEKDQAAILKYAHQYRCPQRSSRKPAPYLYVEFDRRSGFPRRCFFEVTPASINSIADVAAAGPFQRSRDLDQFLFPLFPTVYSPMEYQDADRGYYRTLFSNLRQIAQKAKDGGVGKKFLVMGPATGLEVWLISLFLPRAEIFAAGINPLEVANTRAAARRMEDPRLKTAVHNNILSPEGTLAFDERFDHVLWNMPAYQELPQREQGWFIRFWDGNFNILDLKNLLDGLKRVLKQDGQAWFWNTGRLAKMEAQFDHHRLRASIIEAGGNGGRDYRIFTVSHTLESSL